MGRKDFALFVLCDIDVHYIGCAFTDVKLAESLTVLLTTYHFLHKPVEARLLYKTAMEYSALKCVRRSSEFFNLHSRIIGIGFSMGGR